MPTSTTGIRGALTLVLACALTPSAAISAATTEPQPGDDFFAYANSAWLQATKIPDGAPRWTARSEINDLTRRQLDKLVDDTAGAPADSNARKVANFRAAYLDDEAIESDGVTPLAPTLGRINAISDRTALTRFLGSELRADVDPLNLGIYDSTHLLGLSVEPGLHGEAKMSRSFCKEVSASAIAIATWALRPTTNPCAPDTSDTSDACWRSPDLIRLNNEPQV